MSKELNFKLAAAFKAERMEITSMHAQIIIWSKQVENERQELDRAIIRRDEADGKATTSNSNQSSSTRDEPRTLGARPKEYRQWPQRTNKNNQSSSKEEPENRQREYRRWPKKDSKGKGERSFDSWGRK